MLRAIAVLVAAFQIRMPNRFSDSHGHRRLHPWIFLAGFAGHNFGDPVFGAVIVLPTAVLLVGSLVMWARSDTE